MSLLLLCYSYAKLFLLLTIYFYYRRGLWKRPRTRLRCSWTQSSHSPSSSPSTHPRSTSTSWTSPLSTQICRTWSERSRKLVDFFSQKFRGFLLVKSFEHFLLVNILKHFHYVIFWKIFCYLVSRPFNVLVNSDMVKPVMCTAMHFIINILEKYLHIT